MHFMVIFIKVNLDVLKLLKFVLVFCMTSLVTFFDSRMVTLNLSHTHTPPHTDFYFFFNNNSIHAFRPVCLVRLGCPAGGPGCELT